MRTESLGRSYLALPDSTGPFPGVVVVHEASGLNDNIRGICGWFAAGGYAALGAELFEGRNRVVCMARMFAGGMAGNLDYYGVPALKAALRQLASHPEVDAARIGAVGSVQRTRVEVAVGRTARRCCTCQRPASVRLQLSRARRRMLPSQAICVTTTVTRPVCCCSITGWARRTRLRQAAKTVSPSISTAVTRSDSGPDRSCSPTRNLSSSILMSYTALPGAARYGGGAAGTRAISSSQRSASLRPAVSITQRRMLPFAAILAT